MFAITRNQVRRAKALVGVAVFMGSASTAYAQTLDFAAISKGGGVLPDGSIVVIGQPVTGTISNANFTIDIGIVPFLPGTACPASSQPIAEQILNASGVLVPSVKNRFLSFRISDSRMKAVRVTFVDLWGRFSVFNGISKWVDTPIDSSEAGGLDLLNNTPPTFKSAELVNAPVFRDWSTDGVVHVHDELIIPSRKLPNQPFEPALYWIQVIDQTCALTNPANFSAPLSVTNPQWGDIAELSSGQFVAPGAGVSVTDTLSVLAKFSGASNAPIKVRVEMLGPGPQGPSPIVNGKIDVSDLLAVLDAFSGGAYPF